MAKLLTETKLNNESRRAILPDVFIEAGKSNT